MNANLGTTGLTQKEAIFQIIKSIVGDLLQPSVPLKPLILNPKVHTHGRTRRQSNPFDRFDIFDSVVEEVCKGLVSGLIPSKPREYAEHLKYASRIVHYWLKHDTRLNGGQIGSRVAKSERRKKELTWKLRSDAQLKNLKALASEHANNKDEINQYVMGHTFKIILEVYGVNISELPTELLEDLKIIDSAPIEKMKAA